VTAYLSIKAEVGSSHTTKFFYKDALVGEKLNSIPATRGRHSERLSNKATTVFSYRDMLLKDTVGEK